MSIKVISKDVLNNKKDLNDFVNLPWELYKGDPVWVPPLKMAVKDLLSNKHPFYATADIKCWMAYKDGKAVGRISTSVNNEHNKFHDEKTGFFGFFESIDDKEVSDALFEVAEKELKDRGMNCVRGPFNPSTNYECGTLIEGFDDPPQLMMTYNPKYHLGLIEAHGYDKSKDLLAYKRMLKQELPEVMNRVSDRIEKSNRITYRPANKKDWDNEVELMLEIYNSAWEKNWGFIPMTDDEFRHTAKDLKSIVDTDLVIFVEVNGDVAGFAVALPDYNQVFHKIPNGKLLPFGIFKLLNAKKHINRMRVLTLGIKEEYRKLGLASLMYKKLSDNSKVKYDEVEMSWILEDNLMMNKPLQRMGEVYKKYRIFEKQI